MGAVDQMARSVRFSTAVSIIAAREEIAWSAQRGNDQVDRGPQPRFMHISIMNAHGSAAMMRNTSAPVSQFQFQATLREVAAANRI
jgi:hypothetical protein